VSSSLLKGNPSDKNPLSGKDMKLIPMNLLDEPVEIERFTRNVTMEYYKTPVFRSLRSSMFLYTPCGKMILAVDPSWSRVCWVIEGGVDIHAFGEDIFYEPKDIAGKFPNIFITDPWESRISHFKIVVDSIYFQQRWIKYIREVKFIKHIGEDTLQFPYGIDYSDNGTPLDIDDDKIFVADQKENSIYKFKLDGGLLEKYKGKPYSFNSPQHIAIGKDNGINTDEIYVLQSFKITKFPDILPSSPDFYIETYQFPQTSKIHLTSIAVDWYGYPYVSEYWADNSYDRIVKYKKDLSDTLWSYGSYGFGEGHFNHIHDIYIYQDELLATERWTDSSGISYYWIEGVNDTEPPVVKILSPPDTTYVNGEIKIVGTVKDDYLKYWQVYYGDGVSPDKFNLIDWGTNEKKCEVLTEWNTSGESEIISILLLARDEGGNISTDTVRVWVGEPPIDLSIGDKKRCKSGEFKLPTDVAVDNTFNIYVSDTHNDRIQKFNREGSFLFSFGSHGKGHCNFIKPAGIATRSHKIYIADLNNHRIQVFDTSGSYLYEFGSHGKVRCTFNHPFDVALYEEGDIFVSDRNNHRIQRFAAEGEYISSFGSFGDSTGEFNIPCGIDIIGNQIAVSDRENDRVQILSLSGEVKRIIKSEFNRPYDVGFDSDSSLYVVDCNKNRVQKFDRFGNHLLTIYGDSLKLPMGCEVSDALYVSDTHNNRILKFKGWFSLLGTSRFKLFETLLSKKNSLSCVYPNPCSKEVKIYMETQPKLSAVTQSVESTGGTSSHSVQLDIYNITGRRVRKLFDAEINTNQYLFNWDLRDNSGNVVPSGIYFYRLKVDEKHESKKIVVVR